MVNFAIVEISGRQYLARPGQMIEVDKLPEGAAKLSVDKVLLIAEGNKIELGKPYLKKALDFEVVANIKKPKIRVATYKAKANYRRVVGQRRVVSQIKLAEKGEKTETVKKA